MLWLQVPLNKRQEKDEKHRETAIVDGGRCNLLITLVITAHRLYNLFVCLAADQISKEHENLLSLTYISLRCDENLIRPPC